MKAAEIPTKIYVGLNPTGHLTAAVRISEPCVIIMQLNATLENF